MTPAHSPLAPSAAHRWVECPGSVKLCAQFPEVESEASREGTAAHWALAEMLAGRTVGHGQFTDQGFVLTEELVEVAQMGADQVLRRAAYLDRPLMYVEQGIPIRRVHDECHGTPDVVLHGVGTLDVLDLKAGHGYVEVVANWQLIAYVAGLLDKFDIDGMADQSLVVRMHIIQPRSYSREGPVRTWQVMASDLRGYINRLNMAAETAMGDDAPLSVGEHCMHCPARASCPALQEAALHRVDMVAAGARLDLPPAALGLELRLLKRAEALLAARVSGLEEQAQATIARGETVPGWQMERTPGREEWTADAATVLALGDLFGIALARPAAPITPNQARKAGMSAEVVAGLTQRAPGAAKLTPFDKIAAAKVFPMSY